MMAPPLFIRWSGPELFMSQCFWAHRGSTVFFFFFFFFCSSIPVVLFDNSKISKCLNTLFLLSPYLCFIIGLSVIYLPVMIHG